MSDSTASSYESPSITEYGSVESITQNDKLGDSEDTVTEATADVGVAITGSVV